MSESLNASVVRPSLTCSDLEASLRFYTKGLGFEVESSVERDGVVRFHMLRAGNAMLGIGRDDFAKGRDRVKGVAMRIWIVTAQDVVALAKKVRDAGYALDAEPEALPWGPVSFSVMDPDGFAISVRSET
jgi:uncharacterized glyoxalase superfamily protein PhnB